MRITVLAGGIGAARFLRGLLASLTGPTDATVSAIGNTGDDLTLYGLRVCPDLDTVMYTLGGGNDDTRGWGRADETWNALHELQAYADDDRLGDQVPSWFGLGDRDLGTHLARTTLLAAGRPLSEITEMLSARWKLPAQLLPMSDDRIETQVDVADPSLPDGRRQLHFQEYWVRLHAAMPALRVWFDGVESATPAPGVLDAIAHADIILLPPSNPVVSIGPILAVPGVRQALTNASAPIVGLSPIIDGAPVRGMADKLLPTLGVDTSATGVALHYGYRGAGGLLDGWLVHTDDADAVDRTAASGITCRAVPLLMADLDRTRAMADIALELAQDLATG